MTITNKIDSLNSPLFLHFPILGSGTLRADALDGLESFSSAEKKRLLEEAFRGSSGSRAAPDRPVGRDRVARVKEGISKQERDVDGTARIGASG